MATAGDTCRLVADPKNSLTWRSIANRLWQYHFGQGLVDTPNDFGHMGSAPTHPELLDWLAVTMRDNGGSLKAIHRLMLTSAVYRQSSQHSADGGGSGRRQSVPFADEHPPARCGVGARCDAQAFRTAQSADGRSASQAVLGGQERLACAPRPIISISTSTIRRTIAEAFTGLFSAQCPIR